MKNTKDTNRFLFILASLCIIFASCNSKDATSKESKAAIPFHYGMYEGKAEDAVTFLNKLESAGVYTLIMKKMD